MFSTCRGSSFEPLTASSVCARDLSTSSCGNVGCSKASAKISSPLPRYLVRNSAEMVVKSAPAPASNDPPIKSRSAANCCAERFFVPLRNNAAVCDARPSCPAGSAADPLLINAAKLTMGTPCFSISSTVRPFFITIFSCGGIFMVCAAASDESVSIKITAASVRSKFRAEFIILPAHRFPEAASPPSGCSHRNTLSPRVVHPP